MNVKQSSVTSLLMLCVLSATLLYSIIFCAFIYTQIDNTLELLRIKSLREQASQISDYLEKAPGPHGRKGSADDVLQNSVSPYQYVVRDAKTGKPVMRSPNAMLKNFPAPDADLPEARTFYFNDTQGVRFIGATIHKDHNGRDYIIQIAQSEESIRSFSDILTQAFFQRISLFGIPFLFVLMIVIAMTIKLIMSPITKALKEAHEISFANPDVRLNEAIFPQEIVPLAHAVNDALDRLENGIKAQKDFIADAAHELRTPLSILRSHVDLLEDKVTAARMRDDVDSMARLVSQLLDTARLESPEQLEMHKLDLAELIRAASQAIWPLMVKDNRAFNVEGIDAPVFIMGHFDTAYRALRNLLENALKYSPPGSPISIRLAGHDILVENAGPRIPSEDREKIFEKFSRKDGQRSSGAGLGLFIVRKIMQLHGGSIDVSDAPQGGCIFALRFPEIPPVA